MAEAEALAGITVDQITPTLGKVIKAAEASKHYSSCCDDLAGKARLLDSVLPLYKPAKDEETRRRLRKLKEAFAAVDAPKLVQICKNSAATPQAVAAATKKIKALTAKIRNWENDLIILNQTKLVKLAK